MQLTINIPNKYLDAKKARANGEKSYSIDQALKDLKKIDKNTSIKLLQSTP